MQPWHSLQDPYVRDLAWAWQSPTLMATCVDVPEATPPDPKRLQPWLQHLDRQPQPLRRFLDVQGSPRRVGRYFELLWQYLLQEIPDYRQVRSNLPLRHEGRTLGEIDLLLTDPQGHHHWELAIKFYLGYQPAQWLGPDPRDSLADKFDNLIGRQCQRLQSATSRTLLGLAADTSIANRRLTRGILFQPSHRGDLELPIQAHPHATIGRWSWLTQFHPPAGYWSLLQKPHWLAPNPQAPRLDGRALQQWLAAHANQGLMLQHWRDEHTLEEGERWYIVPDHWPALSRPLPLEP